ncbi:hypothetical protein COCNU_11G004110 [Cocos nucifera]|uniref:FAD-binding domain-containing protein n=1 Tax=Cocos nucifera TaxID=13894 RepID=A0A8K0IQ83_COCNU|nr:hypothetical protein COCNU_11G004110 [Cocos nucifera]
MKPSPFSTGLPLKSPCHPRRIHHSSLPAPVSARFVGRPLHTAIIGGGPAGSSAAEALAGGGVETYLIERSPASPSPSAVPSSSACSTSSPSPPTSSTAASPACASSPPPTSLSTSFAPFAPERIRLPPEKVAHYEDLAEMYVGSYVLPDFYGWVFRKCDHVAVGTGTVTSKPEIKKYQAGIRAWA